MRMDRTSSPPPKLTEDVEKMVEEIFGTDCDQDFSSDDNVRDPDFEVNLKEYYDNISFKIDQDENDNLRDLPSNCSSSTSIQSSRKRKRRPEMWKQNIRKVLREAGQEYTNAKGKKFLKRQVGPPCKPTCFYMCSTNFNEEQRKTIFDEFWRLSDKQKQIYFSDFVKMKECSFRRTDNKNVPNPKKALSYIYYFKHSNSATQVCKTFFINTLMISEQKIYYYFKKNHNADTGVPINSIRGKYQRGTPQQKIDEVKEHIKSFPTVDSHYCRQGTTRKYLDSFLNLTKMYTLYKEKYNDPVGIYTYRKIFNFEFNISFFVPKKDRCDKCLLFEKTNDPSAEEKLNCETHRKEYKFIKAEREKDKNNIDKKTAILCYDLQNVFSLPRGNASNFFYKRKLNTFNLTGTLIIPGKKKITYCALWSEAVGGRAGTDISSALSKILSAIVKDNNQIDHIILWSDSCVPQNRNQLISFAILRFLSENQNIRIVEQKFSEAGHSLIQDVDAVHIAIEKFLKNVEIGSPLSLIRNLKKMNYPKIHLKILQMLPQDFKSYGKLAGEFKFNQIPFSKVKFLNYSQNNLYEIKYKTSAQEINFKSGNLQKSGRFVKDPFKAQLTVIAPKTLSLDKKNDLKSMIPYLDEADKAFFNAILK